jgi:hypothetical protein
MGVRHLWTFLELDQYYTGPATSNLALELQEGVKKWSIIVDSYNLAFYLLHTRIGTHEMIFAAPIWMLEFLFEEWMLVKW